MLYIYSITSQVPAANGPIPFTNVGIQGQCGQVTQATETTVQINTPGVYEVTFNATSPGGATAQLFLNGVAVPGALSTGTTLAFTALIRVNPNCCAVTGNLPGRVQVRNGPATSATFTNAALTIKRVR